MAAWRHPDAHPDFDVDTRRIIDLAKLAERGLFDMFFMANSLTFWRGPLEAMSHDAAGSWIEPLTRDGDGCPAHEAPGPRVHVEHDL